MEGTKLLEEKSTEAGQALDVLAILREYKKHYPHPVWQLTEDIQRQAMMYSNIIESLKSGKTAEEIRLKYEELNLVPGTKLPNPNEGKLLDLAFSKLSAYRRALVDIVKNFGGDLLNELSFSLDLTVTVGVNIGFPPSVSIGVEHSAKAEAVTRFKSSGV